MDQYDHNDDIELQSEDDGYQEDAYESESEPEQQQASESASDSEPEHEENADGDDGNAVNQDAINNAIAKQHAKYREEQRKREQLEQELQQYRNAQNSDPEPEVPEVDPFDDDYEERQRERDEALRRHAAWQYRQQQAQQYQSQLQQQQLQQQQQKAQENAERFFNTAKESGLDEKQLNQAIQTVGQYQLGEQVANYLLSDDKGAQMTVALSKNPALLAELSVMDPTQAVLHIERNVRGKVAQPRRSQSNKPPTRVKGRASDASDKYPLTGGRVTVE